MFFIRAILNIRGNVRAAFTFYISWRNDDRALIGKGLSGGAR